MKVAFLSLGITGLAFCVHLLVWRVRLPYRQTRALIIVFLGTLGVCLGGLVVVPQARVLLPDTFWGVAQVVLFFLAALAAYVITYTAIEADSPTLVMFMHIRAAGAAGLDQEVFDKVFGDEHLVLPRLGDMVRDGLATLDQGRYRLTAKGRRFGRLFAWYRNLLGAELGG